MGRGHPAPSGRRQASGSPYAAVALFPRSCRSDCRNELAGRPGSVRLPQFGKAIVKRLSAATFLLIASLGQTCFAQCIADSDRTRDGEGPVLSFHSAPADPAYGSVDLLHLGAEAIGRLRRADPFQGQWQKVFAVSVDDTNGSAG